MVGFHQIQATRVVGDTVHVQGMKEVHVIEREIATWVHHHMICRVGQIPRPTDPTLGGIRKCQRKIVFLRNFFFCSVPATSRARMTTLLRLNPLKPLRYLRNNVPLASALELRTTTRLTHGPTTFPRVVPPESEDHAGHTFPAGDAPNLALATRTPLSIYRQPRTFVTTRRLALE